MSEKLSQNGFKAGLKQSANNFDIVSKCLQNAFQTVTK